MKAILVAALVATASANPTISCQIPARYTATDANGKCTGENEAYMVWGFCAPGVNRVATNTAITRQVRERLNNAALLNAFVPLAGTDATTGCAIPPVGTAWNVANPMTAGITADATLCIAHNANTQIVGTGAEFKGVEIRCNRANRYYPVQGNEGVNLCADRLANLWPANVATPNAPYWVDPATAFAAVPTGMTSTVNAVLFDGSANSLLCLKGCALPATVCVPGTGFHANIVWAGHQFDEATCILLPLPNAYGVPTVGGGGFGAENMLVPGIAGPVSGLTFPLTAGSWVTNYGVPFVQFTCRTGYNFAPIYTAFCVQDAAVAGGSSIRTVPAYTGQCGGVDGCATNLLWTTNAAGFLGTTVAGDIRNFPTVTSAVTQAYPAVQQSAYASLWTRRYWNNNPVQPLQTGTAFNLAVTGCDGATKEQCIQQTANWWRCMGDFPGCGGTLCWMNTATPIAFPTYELGFRCPSSSKKGLLGLLGLIGILPLLLLCCCLFFLCCIRRRKTETDVHFATFDPHAAPVLGAPTATACPTAFGATPYATHPSAIPVL